MSGLRSFPREVASRAGVRANIPEQRLVIEPIHIGSANKHPPIPFTLTFHPHNHTVKSIILKNFKLLQNDSETGTIFSQPPIISFKRDKNIGNFLVKSSF